MAGWGSSRSAFALFFHNFSTFRGAPGLYLEDLFVEPSWRGRGFGRRLLAHLAAIAVERGCHRMEWSVLDWNESAIAFYRRAGARLLDDWRIFRLTGDALRALAGEGRIGRRCRKRISHSTHLTRPTSPTVSSRALFLWSNDAVKCPLSEEGEFRCATD